MEETKKEKFIWYELTFNAKFDKNRKVKFGTEKLIEVREEAEQPTLDQLRCLTMLACERRNIRGGHWRVIKYPVEYTTYSDGAKIATVSMGTLGQPSLLVGEAS